jgi:hypothetical protein
VAAIACIENRDTLAGAAVTAAGVLLVAAGAAVAATGAPVTALGNPTVGLVMIFWMGGSLTLEGPTLIIPVADMGGTTHRAIRARHMRKAISPPVAATCATVVAILASGSTKVAKGVTSAVTAHIAEGRTLQGAALTMIVAGYVTGWAVIVGPRTIVSRVRQTIDWAIKPPPAEAPGIQPPAGGSTE